MNTLLLRHRKVVAELVEGHVVLHSMTEELAASLAERFPDALFFLVKIKTL